MAMVIYRISNSVNDKVYIGQTIRSLDARLKRHFHDACRNPGSRLKIHRAINKYGTDKFSIEQIDEASSQEELNEKERYWIKKYDSMTNGYNMTEGGDGGNTYSSRSPSQMKATKKKLSKANFGRNNGMSNQIKAKNIKTGEEHFFESLTACLDFLGIKNKTIVMCRVNGKCNTLWRNEWMFAYENAEYSEFHEFHYDLSCHRGQKVILEKAGEQFRFNSKAKACQFMHIGKMPLKNGMVINGYAIILP